MAELVGCQIWQFLADLGCAFDAGQGWSEPGGGTEERGSVFIAEPQSRAFQESAADQDRPYSELIREALASHQRRPHEPQAPKRQPQRLTEAHRGQVMTAQGWAAVFANQLTRAEHIAQEYTALVDRMAAKGWLTVGEYEHQQELLAEFHSMLESHRRLLARESGTR